MTFLDSQLPKNWASCTMITITITATPAEAATAASVTAEAARRAALVALDVD